VSPILVAVKYSVMDPRFHKVLDHVRRQHSRVSHFTELGKNCENESLRRHFHPTTYIPCEIDLDIPQPVLCPVDVYFKALCH
jgi:hypothetical protein